jgi:hypothetical protein
MDAGVLVSRSDQHRAVRGEPQRLGRAGGERAGDVARVQNLSQLFRVECEGVEEFSGPRSGTNVVEHAGRRVRVVDGESVGEAVQQVPGDRRERGGRPVRLGVVVAQPQDLGARVRGVGNETRHVEESVTADAIGHRLGLDVRRVGPAR